MEVILLSRENNASKVARIKVESSLEKKIVITLNLPRMRKNAFDWFLRTQNFFHIYYNNCILLINDLGFLILFLIL